MYIIGIDLSGPGKNQNTSIAPFVSDGKFLDFIENDCDGSDIALLSLIKKLSQEMSVVIGIDAPLSYQPGGGDRERDAELRKRITDRGMRSGSVMAPTAPRMVYVTLRGIVLAQTIKKLRTPHQVQVVEVHPGAALCFRNAPLNAILNFSKDARARHVLYKWLVSSHQIRHLRIPSPCPSHFIAACAGAVAARDWHIGKSAWLVPAQPPWHPYAFAS